MSRNALEEEFFRVEGRSLGGPACEYVIALAQAPDGDRITVEERCALWYIAYWSMDGAAQISVAALAMHLDRGLRETRRILSLLIDQGILRFKGEPLELWRIDEQVYEFVELVGSTQG